ncbi:MAG: phosphate ABC transporter substrate-binding/OmpA family protein [Litoreibacter sp.]
MTSIKTRYLASVATGLAMLAMPALGQDITIQSVDGNSSLSGRLVSFDGENYELDSVIGRLTIPVASVVCIGDACPQIDDGSLTASVGVLDKPSMALLSGLIDAFAQDQGLTLERDADALDATQISLTDEGGDRFGDLSVVKSEQREAFLQLLNGETKFVISTAPILDEIAEELIADGHADLRAPGREVIVALDAIVPVVHPTNTTRDMTLVTLARIAAGRVTNWNELGGPDLPIRMILTEDGSSIAGVFEERIMRPNRLRLNRRLERVETEAEAAAIVADDPAAITVTSNALVETAKTLPVRQVCGPLSVPTNFSVKAEEYPLARRVLIYTSGEQLSESMKNFIAYAGSTSAQTQYRNSGFVGQSVETVPMSLQGARLTSAILHADTPDLFESTRNLTETLTLADRLSTTFRFEPGSTTLDNKSRRDAVRIAQHLLLPENKDREILLFGFTDSVGRSDLNQLLSLQQANSISAAIIEASSGQIDKSRIQVTSYGAVAPVGCNDTVEGRNSNRRVEVWLR